MPQEELSPAEQDLAQELVLVASPNPLRQRGALLLSGRAFTGWKTVKIERTIDSAAGTFRVSTAFDPEPERHEPAGSGVRLPIKPGDAIQARISPPYGLGPSEDDALVTGYVDVLQINLDGGTHEVVVAGRDRTADLVDCSAVGPSAWARAPLRSIVQDLCDPFEIPVTVDPNLADKLPPFGVVKPFDSFSRNESETAWAAIERACRQRGLLCYGRGDGRLQLATVPFRHALTDLREGENVESASLEYALTDRFSEVTVRGQGRGSDIGWGSSVAAVEGSASDSELRRFRPLSILAEGVTDASIARVRAEWEATNRAARSRALKVTVASWRQVPRGRPWAVNEIVRAHIPSLQVSGSFLVSGVAFERTVNGGTTAKLELMRQDAFVPEPIVPEDPSFASVLDDEAVEDFEDEEYGGGF